MTRPLPIGLMGLGRVARNLFRLLWASEEFRIAAMVDPADPEALAYLLRFDTLLGRFPEKLRYADGALVGRDVSIPLITEEEPDEIPWGELGVHTVVETLQIDSTRQEIERHFAAGAKRVVLCVPPLEPPDITVVVGVNDTELRAEHRIVSNASNTAHALAPMLRILDAAFGVDRAFANTVHAYTEAQRLADVPAEDPRRGRAARENIIPQQTNAAQVLEEVFPEMAGRVTALALNVPVAQGSGLDLVCWHREPVTVERVNEAVRAAIMDDWQGVLEYEEAPLVSSDVRMNAHSGVFDSLATMTLGERVSKTLTWFDSGWGYAHRLLDVLRRFRELDEEAEA